MFRGLVMAVAIVGLIAVGLVGGQQLAEAQTASATRSFSPRSEVEGGGTLTVTISVADYGGIGQLKETFDSDFNFVSSSPEVTPSGQTLTFNLVGDTSVSYTLTAPTTPGSRSDFVGNLEPAQGDGVGVGGPSSVEVTVTTPPAQQTASATRSFSPRSEVEGGGTLTVTISVADYGGIGQLKETFDSDFTFVSSSPEVTPSGETLTFNLVGDTSVSYTLTAPTTPGSRSDFVGNLEPAQGDGVGVGGPSSVEVTVATPPAQQTASATRSFSPRSEVEPDGRLVVTIRVADYGGIGQLTETFPGDFTFVSSSPEVTPSGQTLTFDLVGDTSVSYTLTAPTITGEKSGFSGTLDPAVGERVEVSGPSSVQVGRPFPNRAPVFSGNAVTRSVNENSASGANVGARVTASDPDGDSLTYTLAGTDASSFNVAATGQIQVGDGTNLDYEGEKNTYVVEVTATDPSGASDMITVTVNVTNVGEVTLWASATEALTMAPQVGETITGAVMDPDGGVTGESWQWARTTTPAMMDSWMDIAGETNAAYTVTEGDTGYYLRVMATYTDAVGTDTAMEYSMPTMMVGAEAGDPLFGYDTSGNGRIDKDELAKAVFDYEINLTLEKPALADLVFSYEIGL